MKPGGKSYVKIRIPFVEKLSGRTLYKMFVGDINHTLKLKVQDNQAVVEFENKSNTTTELRRKTVLGISDLRSMGYFKVGYKKMVTMAESCNSFHMYHYQQRAKSKSKAECGLYFKCHVIEDHPEILQTEVRNLTENLGRTHTLGWQKMIQKVPITC